MKYFSSMAQITLLVAALGVSGVSALWAQERDPELLETIETYRAEGAESTLGIFERLQAQFAQSGDHYNETVATRYVGEAHWRLGTLDESRAHLERALSLSREIGHREEEASILNVLGLLEWEEGDYASAKADFLTTGDIARDLGDLELAGMATNNYSLVLDEQGEFEASLQGYREALSLYEQTGFERGRGDTLGNIGGVYLLLGRFHEALDYYEQALAISEQLGSKPAMTLDHGNIAFCHVGLGDTQAALGHFDRALVLAREAGMQLEEAYWQRGKANALIGSGRYGEGLELHGAALAAYEQAGARSLMVDALHDLGRIHLSLGDTASAQTYFQRSIDLAREIGMHQGLTLALLALGDLHFELDNFEEAAALYTRALERATVSRMQNLQAETLLRQALVARENGELDVAEQAARGALEIANVIGVDPIQAEAHYSLGELARRRGRLQVAFQAFSDAEEAAGAFADPELMWQLRYARALTLIDADKREAAVDELLASVQIIESVRGRLKEQRFRAGYIQDKSQVYIDLVRLQLELGRISEAFSTSERLRARSFIEQLERGRAFSRSGRKPGARPEREAALRERIRQLQAAVLEEQSHQRSEQREAALSAWSKELLDAEREYQALLDDRTSMQKNLETVLAVSSTDVQSRLNAGEALLEYVMFEDEIVIFLLRPSGLMASSARLTRKSATAMVDLLRELVRERSSERWLQPARNLARSLVAPLIDRHLLDGIEQVYLVPHGVLHYLPFGLLPVENTGSELMIDRFTVSYLPAAASLLREPGGGGKTTRGLLAMAPQRARLQYAPQEARSVSEIFHPDAELLAGKSATEGAFKRHAPHFSYLHLSTHGYFNKFNPMLSGLELEADSQDDGLLEVHEILGLELGAGLVTLSACETGLGGGFFNEIPAGDDFVGLARAFLLAGSGSVLASLWKVDDRSTVELMEAFYQRLGRQNSAPAGARALALTQRRMRASGEYSHPFYWAPFILMGGRAQARDPRLLSQEG